MTCVFCASCVSESCDPWTPCACNGQNQGHTVCEYVVASVTCAPQNTSSLRNLGVSSLFFFFSPLLHLCRISHKTVGVSKWLKGHIRPASTGASIVLSFFILYIYFAGSKWAVYLKFLLSLESESPRCLAGERELGLRRRTSRDFSALSREWDRDRLLLCLSLDLDLERSRLVGDLLRWYRDCPSICPAGKRNKS